MSSRSSRRRLLAWAAAVSLVAMCASTGCGGERSTGAPSAPSGQMSVQARAYLDELIAVMEAHSINRLKIDWGSFRTSVMAAAGGAQSVEQTFPAIRTALALLGDGHSLYQPVNGPAIAVRAPGGCSWPGAGVPALPATVGYVRVGSFSGSASEASIFARALQQEIARADRDDLSGWIVDLRGNGGGNMWPMIAGVGPILGEGIAGYFIDPVGVESVWGYREGASWNDQSVLQPVDAPYRLRRPSPKVAVLIDRGTASSGEAVVIAFRRRPGTRSFGTATCGLSTANQQYTMSDGASLLLTEATMADRTKFLYGGRIVPDEEWPTPREAEERAVAWVQTGGDAVHR